MREIKFRAWDGERKVMMQPLILPMNAGLMKLEDLFKITNWAFMQYTGLKDKNGKEIYEGDIVREFDCDLIGEVFFENGAYWFDRNNYMPLQDISRQNTALVEVIGNIYQNSELLKD